MPAFYFLVWVSNIFFQFGGFFHNSLECKIWGREQKSSVLYQGMYVTLLLEDEWLENEWNIEEVGWLKANCNLIIRLLKKWTVENQGKISLPEEWATNSKLLIRLRE